MTVTVKRRFRAALEGRIRQFVNSDEEVNDEMREMIRVLSQSRASS